MPEQFIVRVHGKEYGPVDLEELRAWRRDGRLIPGNEVRDANSEAWLQADEFPEIFVDETAPPVQVAASPQMTLSGIFAAGWRIYRRGFGRFFALSLLVSVPSFFIQLAAPFLEMPAKGGPLGNVILAAAVAFVMLAALVIFWPFSLAGAQLLASDLLHERDPRLRELLAASKPLWTRMFLLGLIVYGSYFLWTAIPLLVAASLATAPTPGTLLLILFLLLFTAYMVARLFINFLFWQPCGALSKEVDTMGALRESRDLARCGASLPRFSRPLYRGAIIASLWLFVVIVLNVGIELPATLWRMRGVTTLEQAATMIQSLATGNSLDPLSIATLFLSCLSGALLRGWLAAVIFVLYFDTKTSVYRPTPPE